MKSDTTARAVILFMQMFYIVALHAATSAPGGLLLGKSSPQVLAVDFSNIRQFLVA